jgi:hypothetical protein
MFGLCLLLAHSERWNLTSLIFIPLDLLGIAAALWLILSAIKGILWPSAVARHLAARRRASQPVAPESKLLTTLLTKKSGSRDSGARIAPDSMPGFARNRQLDRPS